MHRNRLTRRDWLRLGAAAAALPLAAGCDAPSADGVTEIRYWTGWTGHELDVQKRLVAEFNRTHPGIRVRILSVANAYQKVRIAFAGGATPDVCSAVWADELAAYAMRGVLLPLDEFLHESGRSGEEWLPGLWRMLQYRNRAHGLVVTTNASFIVFNKEIFREVGLDPERPPRTIEELDAAAWACTRIERDGSMSRYGLRPADLNRWAYSFGGRWADEDGQRITANHPRNVEALRWMASYGKRYDVRRMQSFEETFGRNTGANGPFFTGKVAMWQTGEFALEHLRRYAPDMEWGWFPYPAPPTGRENCVVTAGGSAFVIPAATKHPREAWTFLDWLTRPHAVGEFCEGIANLPPLRSLVGSERFRKEPLFRFALDLAAGENVFGPPVVPTWLRYKQEIQRAEEYAIFGGADPQSLLDGVQARVEQDLARALREAA
ncbi:MAG: ABC transporter substrate-binding protein [Armatimonadota bacterium]